MSAPNHLLRIDRLRLRNFRCFAACELNLHPTLTVLVAENAQGKTALLDALRLALQEFVTSVGRGKQPRGFERTDIHLKRGVHDVMESRLPTSFQVDGQADGEIVSWSRVLSKDSFHARTSTKDTKNIRRIAKRLADQPDVNASLPNNPPTSLPVVVYYGSGRLYDEHRLTEGKRWLAESSPARVSAYLDCLSPSSSYKSFSAWFGLKWEQVSDPRFRAIGFESRPENHIAAVREAVHAVLEPTGWSAVSWQKPQVDDRGRIYRAGCITLEHPDRGRFPLNFLSDGVRNMAALAGDLAHRCVRLNPHLGEAAAKQTPGVVLIDEVDMHLHPAWQQVVIQSLRGAFPLVQFIFSTHSPQVLTTVKRENIRVLGRDANGLWQAVMPDHSPFARESKDALAYVMKVDPLPVKTEEQRDFQTLLHDYEQHVSLGRKDSLAATKLRTKIDAAGYEIPAADLALWEFLGKQKKG
jgi:predicted ATP-binding protein involved in virulence